MQIKNSIKRIIVKNNSKCYKDKERSYIITYLIYLMIYIFVKDMSQSDSRGNKKKLTRIHKIKQ